MFLSSTSIPLFFAYPSFVGIFLAIYGGTHFLKYLLFSFPVNVNVWVSVSFVSSLFLLGVGWSVSSTVSFPILPVILLVSVCVQLRFIQGFVWRFSVSSFLRVLFWSMSGVLPRVCVATPFSLIIYSPHVVFFGSTVSAHHCCVGGFVLRGVFLWSSC